VSTQSFRWLNSSRPKRHVGIRPMEIAAPRTRVATQRTKWRKWECSSKAAVLRRNLQMLARRQPFATGQVLEGQRAGGEVDLEPEGQHGPNGS